MRKIPFKPQAVIFDMDGVIVDSMPYHFIAWYEALRPWGVRVNCFDIYAKEGEKWEKSLTEFLLRAKVVPTKRKLRAIFQAREQIFKKYFRRFVFADAEPLLRCLSAKGYRLALVTGTNSQAVDKILPRNIRRYFEVVVAGDEVARGKPYPDPYLQAARQLSVEPSRCVVIENAPFGIQSAKRAGMFCIAVTTSLPETYLEKADIIVQRLEDMNGIIERSCPNEK